MYPYKMTLLSPLFFRSKQDSGAAGATVTEPWVGDLALGFAINKALGLVHLPFKYTSNTPEYEELLNLCFITSVAMPKGDPKRTRIYDLSTSFMSEGFPRMKYIEDSARASMKTWLKRQGIEPGTVYTFSMATRDGWVPPEQFTIRLGNMQETLALCQRVNEVPETLTVNLFTLKHLFGHESLKDMAYDLLERPAQQYVLAHGVGTHVWQQLVAPYK